VRDRLVFPVRVEEASHVIEGECQEAVVDLQAPAEDVQHGKEHVQANAEEVNEASEDFEEACGYPK
jgi:hypothetical protein